MGQLSLFGSEAGTGRSDATAEPSSAALLRARRRLDSLPPGIRFGTSSWTFEGWKGLVYSDAYASKKAFLSGSLAEYAAHGLFRTVGLDSSYYRAPSEEQLAAMARVLPADFRMVVKCWSGLSTLCFPRHPRYGAQAGALNPDFLSSELMAERVIGPCSRGLGQKLGCLLVEIPPVDPTDLPPAAWLWARMRQFLKTLPPGFPVAFEVRTPELLCPSYRSVLAEAGAHHCFNVWTRMPSIVEQQRRLGEPLPGQQLVRLMLPQGTSYGRRKEEMAPFHLLRDIQPPARREVVALAVDCAAAGIPLSVVVNNKFEGSSPLTVAGLVEEVADALGLPSGVPPG